MQSGTVTDYADDMEMGVIKTPDEKRFIFSRPDWLSAEVRPAPGVAVTFDPVGPAARKVIVIGGTDRAEK
jgi:hypothetical protein